MAIVGALTALGLVLRLIYFDRTLVGDELSTLWIVSDRSASEVVDLVHSDAELSPPLYFLAAWVSTQLGSAPELVRLPALIAGVAAIPLTYLVGVRTLSRAAGVVAAAVMTLSPFMLFYATDGRGYSLAIALLLGSTLALLLAVRGPGRGWWIAYGACTCLAMYAHYTAAFVLAAQLGWVLWAHPQARRPALLATGAAAVVYLPWLTGAVADTNSPTVEILSAIQGDGFDTKRIAVETWAYGVPYGGLDQVPGVLARVLLVAGLGIALGAALVRWMQSDRPLGVAPGTVLVLALLLATPVCEAVIVLLGGTDLFGARNLNTAWGGLALTIGAILTAAGPLIGIACGLAVFGAYGITAARTLDDSYGSINGKAAAEFIEAEAGPADVVVDMVAPDLTPVPLTLLDVHLSRPLAEFRPGMFVGDPPFLPLTPIRDPVAELERAFEEAEGHRLFLVAPEGTLSPTTENPRAIIDTSGSAGPSVFPLPDNARLVTELTLPGPRRIEVAEFEVG